MLNGFAVYASAIAFGCAALICFRSVNVAIPIWVMSSMTGQNQQDSDIALTRLHCALFR